MNFLNETQKRIVGWSIAGISVLVLVGILFLLGFGLFALVKELQDVFLPLGIAAIIAYILHPAVVFLENKGKLSRSNAILVLLAILFLMMIGVGLWLFPKLYQEGVKFSADLPDKILLWKGSIERSSNDYPAVQKKLNELQVMFQSEWPSWSQQALTYFWQGIKGVGGTASLILGFLFIPFYLFYFLRDQASIESTWRRYIPLHPSPWKEELVFVIGEINRYLIVFFRGQVLVAMVIGVMTSIGLMIVGIPYALILGMMTGFLSIVPYLGIVIGLTASGLIAFIQPDGGWGLVLGVGIVFSVVQFLEGFFISPKIMGDRTGLHPLTVILAILVWSHLLGGIVGAILAIPLTATLRVLMFRYVWKD